MYVYRWTWNSLTPQFSRRPLSAFQLLHIQRPTSVFSPSIKVFFYSAKETTSHKTQYAAISPFIHRWQLTARTHSVVHKPIPVGLLLLSRTNTVARLHTHTHAHTHTRLTALCPGLPGWAGTRKVQSIWILLKQETVGGSSISWAICKPTPRSTPATHCSVFYRPAALPAAQPTASKHWRHCTSSVNCLYDVLLVLSFCMRLVTYSEFGHKALYLVYRPTHHD